MVVFRHKYYFRTESSVRLNQSNLKPGDFDVPISLVYFKIIMVRLKTKSR